MTANRPAFYARTGNTAGDLIAVLHPPYTAWHLSYVAMGAAVAPAVDWARLAGTLGAFLFGTGIMAHAFDEWHGRPLRTTLSNHVLVAIGLGGLAGALGIAAAGAVVVSPWVLAWAGAGAFLAAGYALEWHRTLHSDLGFAVSWGAFPAIVGYWAQAETLPLRVLPLATAAVLLSLAQRALSRRARFVRRSVTELSVSFLAAEGPSGWSRDELLSSWEWPLRLLATAVVMLAVGLLAFRA